MDRTDDDGQVEVAAGGGLPGVVAWAHPLWHCSQRGGRGGRSSKDPGSGVM